MSDSIETARRSQRAVPISRPEMRRNRLWAAGIAGYGLLLGAMHLCLGFLRGPGDWLVPLPLAGLAAACWFGARRREGDTRSVRVLGGLLCGAVFIFLTYVPSLLRSAWLEWEVAAVPVPPDATSVTRGYDETMFTGRWAWIVTCRSELSAAEVQEFYRRKLGGNGWSYKTTEFGPLRLLRNIPRLQGHTLTFTRGRETVRVEILENTSWNYVHVLRDDPLPPFGLVRLPDLPWTSRPGVPVRPAAPSGSP